MIFYLKFEKTYYYGVVIKIKRFRENRSFTQNYTAEQLYNSQNIYSKIEVEQ